VTQWTKEKDTFKTHELASDFSEAILFDDFLPQKCFTGKFASLLLASSKIIKNVPDPFIMKVARRRLPMCFRAVCRHEVCPRQKHGESGERDPIWGFGDNAPMQ
jgi:hypothetical protein